MVIIKVTKRKDDDYIEFLDRFDNKIGNPMKLDNWIKSQSLRYDPEYLRKFIKKNKRFWW